MKKGMLFRGALIVVALILILLPPSALGSSFTRISAGVLFLTAAIFFYLGAGELLSGISLSRRLVLSFFSVVLLWGLTGFAGSGERISNTSGDHQRARRLRDLGERIDNVAEVGSGQVKSFVDSIFTGQTGEFLGTLGEVTGAATGVLINAVLTSTSVDTSSGSDTLNTEIQGNQGSIPGVPLIRLAILAVTLVLLSSIRGFVYVDRSPLTVWLYRITVFVVFASSILHVLGMNLTLTSRSALFRGIELELSGVLLLLLSIALGLCQRWVQYLSRKSRYMLLLAALAAVVMMRGVYYWLSGNGIPGTGGLETAAAMVSAVYILFAFFTMLLQLPTARILEKKSRELATLQDLSQVLHSSFELDQLCNAAVRLGVNLTGADVCWFHLNSGDDHLHSRSSGFETLPEKIPENWYRGLSQRIDATGGGFMINNYRRSTLRKLEDDSNGYSRIASMVAAPVEVRGERLGVIMAASSKQFFFLDYTRGLFESFTRQIAQAVQSARLFGDKLQRESLERELELARDLQRNLLPGEISQPEGWEIEALSIPCRTMGGDYYDVIPLSDGRIAVTIADVSGKGAAAALLMAALQASLGTLLRESLPVAETVFRLNRALCGRMPDDTFITFFLAFADTETGQIEYCCAGHDPPMLCSGAGAGDMEIMDRGGLILGVIPEAEYSMATVEMKPGSRLLLYTDGVTETMTPDEEPFGVERLRTFVQKHCKEPAGEIVSTLTGILEKFRGDTDQQDDVTALVIVRKNSGERKCLNTIP